MQRLIFAAALAAAAAFRPPCATRIAHQPRRPAPSSKTNRAAAALSALAKDDQPEEDTEPTLYDVLLCAPNATEHELRQAYKQQALHVHDALSISRSLGCASRSLRTSAHLHTTREVTGPAPALAVAPGQEFRARGGGAF